MKQPRGKVGRGSRGRAALGRRALRVATRYAVYLAAVWFALVFFNKVWHPIGLNRQLRRDLDATRGEIARQQAEHEVLKRREAYLKTPEGIQAEARKLGYIREGEMPLRLQEPPQPKPAPQTPAKTGTD